LLAGPPELRERQAADFAFITQSVAGLADPRLRMLCQLFLTELGERFRRTAHSLKSNGLTFGALAFAAQAKTLELAGLAAVKAQGGDPLAALAAEYRSAAAALEALARA